MSDYATTERHSRREGMELAGMFGRDRVTRSAASGFDTVAFYASLKVPEKPKAKLKRRRKKGRAA